MSSYWSKSEKLLLRVLRISLLYFPLEKLKTLTCGTWADTATENCGFCYCLKAQEPVNNLSCSLNLSLVLQHGSQTEVGWYSLHGQTQGKQCTFMHLSDVLACCLAGKSPCCSKLFKLWAATTPTLSISWF